MIHQRIFSGLLLLNLLSSVNLSSTSGSAARDITEDLLSKDSKYVTQYFEHPGIPLKYKAQIRKYLLDRYDAEIESILKDKQVQKQEKRALCNLYAEAISLGVYDETTQRAITTQGNSSFLWNLNNPTQPTYSQFPTSAPVTMALFNPSNDYVLTLNKNNELEYWNLENLDNKLLLRPELAVTALTLSSNGKNAFIAFENQSICYCSLKNLNTPRCIIPYTPSKVRALACYAKCNYLITSDSNGIIHFWDFKKGSMVVSFNSKEYMHFLPNETHAPTIMDLQIINNDQLLAINYKTSHGCGTLNLNFSRLKKYLKLAQEASYKLPDISNCIISDMFILFNKKAQHSLLSLNYAVNGTDFYPMYKDGTLKQMQIMRNFPCDPKTFATKDLMLLLLAYNQTNMLYQ